MQGDIFLPIGWLSSVMSVHRAQLNPVQNKNFKSNIDHQTLTLSLAVCDKICRGTTSFSSGSTKTPLGFQNKDEYISMQTTTEERWPSKEFES